MPVEHRTVAQPLRPRRPDVVGAEHVEHAGARDPAVLRKEDDGEGDGRQHQVMGHVECPHEAGAPQAQVVHAGERKQRNSNREDEEQHDPGPEYGRRIAGERQHGDEVGNDASRPARSEHAQEGAEGERDRHGGHDEQDRRRQAGKNEIDDRRVEEQRVSKIPRQHPLHIDKELMVEGVVEAVGLADVAKYLLGDAAHPARDGQGRVAGRKLDQDEVENENRCDQRGGTEEAAPEDECEPHASGIRRSGQQGQCGGGRSRRPPR